MSTVFFYFATLTCLVRAVVRTTRGLHILQLDGYKTGRYLKWMRQHLRNCFETKEILAIGGILILTAFYPQYNDTWLFPVLCLVWGGFQIYMSTQRKKIEAKKPLVYTARAKRVFGLSICLLIGIATTLVLIAKTSVFAWAFPRWRISIFLFSEITVINLTIANFLIYPLERTINGSVSSFSKKANQNVPAQSCRDHRKLRQDEY